MIRRPLARTIPYIQHTTHRAPVVSYSIYRVKKKAPSRKTGFQISRIYVHMYITLHSQSLLGIVPLRSACARAIDLLGDRATSGPRRATFCERKIYRHLPAHRRTVSECSAAFIRHLFRSGSIVTIQFPLPRETKHPCGEARTLSGSIGGSVRFCYASRTSMGVGELYLQKESCVLSITSNKYTVRSSYVRSLLSRRRRRPSAGTPGD